LQESLLRDVFRGLRVTERAPKKFLKPRSMILIEALKRFAIPGVQPIPR